jgi:hypothetical protein
MTCQPIRIAVLNFAHETLTFLPNDAVMRICADVGKTCELSR